MILGSNTIETKITYISNNMNHPSVFNISGPVARYYPLAGKNCFLKATVFYRVSISAHVI